MDSVERKKADQSLEIFNKAFHSKPKVFSPPPYEAIAKLKDQPLSPRTDVDETNQGKLILLYVISMIELTTIWTSMRDFKLHTKYIDSTYRSNIKSCNKDLSKVEELLTST